MREGRRQGWESHRKTIMLLPLRLIVQTVVLFCTVTQQPDCRTRTPAPSPTFFASSRPSLTPAGRLHPVACGSNMWPRPRRRPPSCDPEDRPASSRLGEGSAEVSGSACQPIATLLFHSIARLRWNVRRCKECTPQPRCCGRTHASLRRSQPQAKREPESLVRFRNRGKAGGVIL